MPRVLHAGQWRGHEVLVQSALPVWRPRAPLTARRLTAAMREVAGCCGMPTGALARSAYWAELRGRLAGGRRPARGGRRSPRPAELLGATPATPRCAYGAWHGDWAPWNMANLADALLVWDWERFAAGRAGRLRRAAPRAAAAASSRTGDAAGAVRGDRRGRAGELLRAVRRRDRGAAS